MSGIDPALLQAQWLQYQQGQLSQSAITPQYQQQYAPPYAPPYAPTQPAGEFVSTETIAALAQFMESANAASVAAAEYIGLLESMAIEHKKLIHFSAAQDDLIWRFLHDREFALDYARGAWTRDAISDEFMSRLAEVYLEIAALSPRGTGVGSNPAYTGNPNIQFTAQVVPQNPAPQNLIPPLPSSSGNATPYITMEQYLIAQQQGQVAQARAAALQNPAGLYSALFQ